MKVALKMNNSVRLAASRRHSAAVCRAYRPAFTSFAAARPRAEKRLRKIIANATEAEEKVESVPLINAQPAEEEEVDTFVPVLAPEELPKGVRKEVMLNGRNVLLFWYRNEIYCIEARSPTEGAYSEGFIAAKFTQDFGIACPATGTVYSLKDGSVLDWYPNNPVLKVLVSPSTARKLQIFPVKLAQDAILVDTGVANYGGMLDRGGADSSLEGNNVLPVQPKLYYEGTEKGTPIDVGSSEALLPKGSVNPGILIAGTLAVGIVAVAGTATFIYYEDYIALGGFWAVVAGVSITLAVNYLKSLDGPSSAAAPTSTDGSSNDSSS